MADGTASPSLADRLRELIAEGLTSGEARNIFAAADQESFAAEIEAARQQYTSDEVEIDDMPEVSPADLGVWVSAWVWIARDEQETCRTCDAPLDEAGDGWDGECGDCADKSAGES